MRVIEAAVSWDWRSAAVAFKGREVGGCTPKGAALGEREEGEAGAAIKVRPKREMEGDWVRSCWSLAGEGSEGVELRPEEESVI